MIKERADRADTPFLHFMQADLVLYLNSKCQASTTDNYSRTWYPSTLPFSESVYNPFELFARAVSGRYLQRISSLFGAPTAGDVKTFLDKFGTGELSAPVFGGWPMEISELTRAC